MSATPYQGFGYYTGLVSALTGQLKGEAEADRIRRQQEQLAQQNLMKSLQFQQEQEMDAARLDLDERKLQEAVLGRKAKAANGGLTPYQELQERRRQADDEVKIGDMEDALSTINGTEPTMVDGPEIPDSGWFWKERQQVEAPITVSIRGQPVTGKKQDLAASVQRRIDALRGLSAELKAGKLPILQDQEPDTIGDRYGRVQKHPAVDLLPAVEQAAPGLSPEQRAMLQTFAPLPQARGGNQTPATITPESLPLAKAGVEQEILRRLASGPDTIGDRYGRVQKHPAVDLLPAVEQAAPGLSKEDIDALRKEHVSQRPPDVSRSTARKQAQIKFPYPPRVSEGGALPRMRAGEQDEELQPGEAAVSQEPTMQASAGVKAEILRRLQGKPGSEDNARRLQILAALKARKARSN